MRARQLIRVLKEFGISYDAARGKGSHGMLSSAEGRYPLPTHDGANTELADVYVRAVCRRFGLVEDELRKRL